MRGMNLRQSAPGLGAGIAMVERIRLDGWDGDDARGGSTSGPGVAAGQRIGQECADQT